MARRHAAGYLRRVEDWRQNLIDDEDGILKPDSAGLEPLEWAAKVPKARLRGGCCGTDARYLGALRATSR